MISLNPVFAFTYLKKYGGEGKAVLTITENI